MRTLKDFTAEQIAAAKTWMANELEAMSEAQYDKTLLQVLQLHHPTGHVGDVPSVVMTTPKPVEGEFLQGEEPLLEIYGKEDEVKAMPEFNQPGPKEFEDKVVQRLMLAMARGEIKLELDGTPEGKLRDTATIKAYLDKEGYTGQYPNRVSHLIATTPDPEAGLSQERLFGPIWFETPDNNGMIMSKHVRDEDNLLMPKDAGRLEMVISPDAIAKRLVGPWDGPGWDKGMDEATRLERMQIYQRNFGGRHPDLERGKDVKLHIVPVKKDD